MYIFFAAIFHILYCLEFIMYIFYIEIILRVFPKHKIKKKNEKF